MRGRKGKVNKFGEASSNLQMVWVREGLNHFGGKWDGLHYFGVSRRGYTTTG